MERQQRETRRRAADRGYADDFQGSCEGIGVEDEAVQVLWRGGMDS